VSLWFDRLDEAELAAHYSGATAVTEGGVPTAQSQLAQLDAPMRHANLVDVVLIGLTATAVLHAGGGVGTRPGVHNRGNTRRAHASCW
jgi:hypothetical protein